MSCHITDRREVLDEKEFSRLRISVTPLWNSRLDILCIKLLTSGAIWQLLLKERGSQGVIGTLLLCLLGSISVHFLHSCQQGGWGNIHLQLYTLDACPSWRPLTWTGREIWSSDVGNFKDALEKWEKNSCHLYRKP